jgi:site-specific recombinase XerD
MFERLAKRGAVLRQFRTAPFAPERERFLVHLQQNGYGQDRLAVINRLLLAVASRVRLDERVTYSPGNLSALARSWIQGRPNRGASKKTLHVMEMDFLFVARRWMEFLGRLVIPLPPQPYANELNAFLDHLRTERGFAEATIDNRRKSLKLFFAWLAKQAQPLSQVGLAEITSYQSDCALRRWKRTTISLHVQALRAFFRYGAPREWCRDISPAIAAPRLYANEGIPQGPSWAEVRKLIENESGDSAVQVRNRAMLLLFAVYGFRLSEVRNLQLDDLDWEKERIVIRRSKLRKTQEFPLAREVGDAILRYLREIRPKSRHRVLFLSLRQPYRPLSGAGLSAMVQTRMRRLNAGFTRFGPHSLRHACAAHLLAEGLTLKEIGDHLGHVSVAATKMYAKVDILGLREVAELNLPELVCYAESAERNQTPIIPRGDLAGLRLVANLPLGAVM